MPGLVPLPQCSIPWGMGREGGSPMRLADKTVLISGAGSGTRPLPCPLFAREGASIVPLDIPEDALREPASSIEGEGRLPAGRQGRIVPGVGNVAAAPDAGGGGA